MPLTPKAADSDLTVIGSSMRIGSPFCRPVLARACLPRAWLLIQMAIDAGAMAGGVGQADLAFGQIGFGEFAELFHRFAATAIDAAATTLRIGAAGLGGGGFFLCLFFFLVGHLYAASGGRAGLGKRRGIAGRVGRGPAAAAARNRDRFWRFHAHHARALNLGRRQLAAIKLRGDGNGFAFDRGGALADAALEAHGGTGGRADGHAPCPRRAEPATGQRRRDARRCRRRGAAGLPVAACRTAAGACGGTGAADGAVRRLVAGCPRRHRRMSVAFHGTGDGEFAACSRCPGWRWTGRRMAASGVGALAHALRRQRFDGRRGVASPPLRRGRSSTTISGGNAIARTLVLGRAELLPKE